MTLPNHPRRSGLMVIAVAALSSIGLMTTPTTVNAGGVSTGAAVGIGLGAFALGTVAGARPYYGAPYGYYAPAPAYYYPPAPAYYPYPPPRNCWDPYYQRYYAC